ncbi:MAG: hypothetical protein CMI60_21445 [Parvibaculum sp.]|nr:hypothetical protein [Parvibaculum sp.]|tara:strand:- start:148 stop:987 length:840 start_codon:yes stop_codon:yes gene_type:complete
MSTSISTSFVTIFDAEVKQAYQQDRKLAGTVRERTGVSGNSYKFNKLGSGVANLHIPQSDVTPMNLTHTQVTATMEDYNAAEYSDIFTSGKVLFDERAELVKAVSMAVGRRMDQLVIDALDGAGTSLTVANSIGGSNTNLNVDKVLETKKLMDQKGVPSEDRYFLCHANNMAAFLDDSDVKTIDVNTTKALAQGTVDSFLGFKFIMVGDRTEGGLAVDGSADRTCLAWHKNACGLAINMDKKTEINYIAEKSSFLVNSMFSAGSVGIDAEGIVEVTCRE